MIIFSITHLLHSVEPLSPPHFLSCGARQQKSRSQVAPSPPLRAPQTPSGPLPAPPSPPMGPLTAPDRLFGSNDTSRSAMATTELPQTPPPVCWIPFPASHSQSNLKPEQQVPAHPPDSQRLSN